MIDTHAHLYLEDYAEDRAETIERAVKEGVKQIFLPATDYNSSRQVLEMAEEYPGICYPMIGLHPEDVKINYLDELERIHELLIAKRDKVIAIGEIGLDYYWSREFEQEQIEAFKIQVGWALELELPIMVHCRSAQNELVKTLKTITKGRPEDKLRGIFHCFTGNPIEARELLNFNNFYLGIGGVLTFKKSKLPETLAQAVPLDRIVLETDSPYMAPTPYRGKRNESSFVKQVLLQLSDIYGVSPEEVDRITSQNATILHFDSPICD